MKRVALILLTIIVLYIAVGACVYQNDVSTDWCYSGDREFDPVELGWYAAIWPLRLAAGNGFCLS